MRRLVASLFILLALTACGGDDDNAIPADEYLEESVPVTEPPQIGAVDEHGQVHQAGSLRAEVVVFPDGTRLNCAYLYDASLECFPAKAS